MGVLPFARGSFATFGRDVYTERRGGGPLRRAMAQSEGDVQQLGAGATLPVRGTCASLEGDVCYYSKNLLSSSYEGRHLRL